MINFDSLQGDQEQPPLVFDPDQVVPTFSSFVMEPLSASAIQEAAEAIPKRKPRRRRVVQGILVDEPTKISKEEFKAHMKDIEELLVRPNQREALPIVAGKNLKKAYKEQTKFISTALQHNEDNEWTPLLNMPTNRPIAERPHNVKGLEIPLKDLSNFFEHLFESVAESPVEEISKSNQPTELEDLLPRSPSHIVEEQRNLDEPWRYDENVPPPNFGKTSMAASESGYLTKETFTAGYSMGAYPVVQPNRRSVLEHDLPEEMDPVQDMSVPRPREGSTSPRFDNIQDNMPMFMDQSRQQSRSPSIEANMPDSFIWQEIVRTAPGEGDVVEFNTIMRGQSKADCARAFYNVLVLCKQDKIQVRQREPFGEIQIKIRSKFREHAGRET
jgi:hypothetical protein